MSLKDDDFLWLLNSLKDVKKNKKTLQFKLKQYYLIKAPKDFDTIHGIRFTINNLIIIKQGEPKHWFYTNEKVH